MKHGQILGILALLLVCALTVIPALAANETPAKDAATSYYNAAVQLTSSGDYPGAIALYDQALGSNTTMIRITDVLLYTYQGKAYSQIQLGKYTEAIATIDTGLADYPSDPKLWNNKGYAQYSLKKYADAVTSYDRAIAIDGNYTGALINKGDALFSLGNYQDAITSYKAALASDPGNSVATAKLADAEKAAASALPITLIALVVVVIVAAAGIAYYVTNKTPAGENAADTSDKKTGTKKNKK
jgi:tetratricopeptide (TPR) repeat protein